VRQHRFSQNSGGCAGLDQLSTFSLDAWYLIERGQGMASLAYMLSSVVLSVAALIGALHLVLIGALHLVRTLT
jgi:fluoride ion exporter CrcB/FEX